MRRKEKAKKGSDSQFKTLRGVPAAHGGFETFAERLALYLVAHGWRVVVYCQEEGSGPVFEDAWQGIERTHIPVTQEGPKGKLLCLTGKPLNMQPGLAIYV